MADTVDLAQDAAEILKSAKLVDGERVYQLASADQGAFLEDVCERAIEELEEDIRIGLRDWEVK